MRTYADVRADASLAHIRACPDADRSTAPPSTAFRWQQHLQVLVYLLYWYKSTNTDSSTAFRWQQHLQVLVYLLYWHKSTNTDSSTAFRSQQPLQHALHSAWPPPHLEAVRWRQVGGGGASLEKYKY